MSIPASARLASAAMAVAAPFNIVSAGVLEMIPAPMLRAPNTFVVASLHDVIRVLENAPVRPPGARIAVDLVGHSTRDHQLLRLGATTIDALDLGVLRWFECLARSDLLSRVHACCVRLLGCETATSASGQRTLRLLASVLHLPVFGTRKPIMRTHHTEQGFNPMFQHLLVEAAQLRATRTPA